MIVFASKTCFNLLSAYVCVLNCLLLLHHLIRYNRRIIIIINCAATSSKRTSGVVVAVIKRHSPSCICMRCFDAVILARARGQFGDKSNGGEGCCCDDGGQDEERLCISLSHPCYSTKNNEKPFDMHHSLVCVCQLIMMTINAKIG